MSHKNKKKCLDLFNVTNQKDVQKDVRQLEDCILVLPTDYRKSMTYHMLVSLGQEMGTNDKNAKVSVCSTFVAIMQEFERDSS